MKGTAKKYSSPYEGDEEEDHSDDDTSESNDEQEVPRRSSRFFLHHPPTPWVLPHRKETRGEEWGGSGGVVVPGPPLSQGGGTLIVRLPTPRDILLGRNSKVRSHPGNGVMRSITKKHREAYSSLQVHHRHAYCEAVLDEIYGSGARFLKQVWTDQGDVWEEVDRLVAHRKVGEALHGTGRRGRPWQMDREQSNTERFQDQVSGELRVGPRQQPPLGTPAAPAYPSSPLAAPVPVAYPGLGSVGLQNLYAPSVVPPLPVHHPGMGTPVLGTSHGSSMLGTMGCVGAPPMGGGSLSNLPFLLSGLVPLIQNNPGLGTFVQQILGSVTNSSSNPYVPGNGTPPPLTMNSPPTTDNFSSHLVNDMRNLAQTYASSSTTTADDMPYNKSRIHQQAQQHNRDSKVSGTWTESRKKPSALDFNGTPISKQGWENTGRRDNALPSTLPPRGAKDTHGARQDLHSPADHGPSSGLIYTTRQLNWENSALTDNNTNTNTNNTPRFTPPLMGMDYAHAVIQGSVSSTSQSWENMGLSDYTPPSSPALQGTDNEHAVTMEGLRSPAVHAHSDAGNNSWERSQRAGPSGSYDGAACSLRDKRPSTTMKQQVDSFMLGRPKGTPPQIQPSDIGRIVWVTGREGSEVSQPDGTIEALKEELDDTAEENSGTTGMPATRWMILIRYDTSTTPSKEWISADRVQFKPPNTSRSSEKVVFTPITPTAKSPPRKRMKSSGTEGESVVMPLHQEKQKPLDRMSRSKNKSSKAAVVVEKGKRPGDEYYKVDRITGFRMVDKRILFEIQWVGGEVTWEPLSCLSQEAFEAAKDLVVAALESKPRNKEIVTLDLIRIAKKEFDIDVEAVKGSGSKEPRKKP